MCFHYALNASIQSIGSRFRADVGRISAFSSSTHFNGFAFPAAPVILLDEVNRALLFKWGLIPDWVKSTEEARKIQANTLNARSETIFEKPSFKNPVIHQRCLVPASGFFEWKLHEKRKYPHYIYLKNSELFAFAGIYSVWSTNKGKQTAFTFSIITKKANPVMADIHNTKKRMPVILSPTNEQRWLSPGLKQTEIAGILAAEQNENLAYHTIASAFLHEPGSNTNVLKPHFYHELNNNTLF